MAAERFSAKLLSVVRRLLKIVVVVVQEEKWKDCVRGSQRPTTVITAWRRWGGEGGREGGGVEMRGMGMGRNGESGWGRDGTPHSSSRIKNLKQPHCQPQDLRRGSWGTEAYSGNDDNGTSNHVAQVNQVGWKFICITSVRDRRLSVELPGLFVWAFNCIWFPLCCSHRNGDSCGVWVKFIYCIFNFYFTFIWSSFYLHLFNSYTT